MKKYIILVTILFMTVVLESSACCYQYETAWVTSSPTGTGYTAFIVDQSIPIYAGQNIFIGTVTLHVEGDYMTFQFNFEDGWLLDGVPENIKIEAYNIAPTGKFVPGKFDYKMSKSAWYSYIYVGTSEQIPVASYYAIHLDVKKEIPCI